jgi:hypothetical protein
LFAFSACSTAATIERRGWPDYRGTIEGSDSESVHVRDENGDTYRVLRTDIVDIHHPGKMSLAIGVVLLGLAVSMALLPSRNGEDYTFIAVTNGCLFGIPGAILAINGVTKYAESKFAAKADAATASSAANQEPTPCAHLRAGLARTATAVAQLRIPSPASVSASAVGERAGCRAPAERAGRASSICTRSACTR